MTVREQGATRRITLDDVRPAKPRPNFRPGTRVEPFRRLPQVNPRPPGAAPVGNPTAQQPYMDEARLIKLAGSQLVQRFTRVTPYGRLIDIASIMYELYKLETEGQGAKVRVPDGPPIPRPVPYFDPAVWTPFEAPVLPVLPGYTGIRGYAAEWNTATGHSLTPGYDGAPEHDFFRFFASHAWSDAAPLPDNTQYIHMVLDGYTFPAGHPWYPGEAGLLQWDVSERIPGSEWSDPAWEQPYKDITLPSGRRHGVAMLPPLDPNVMRNLPSVPVAPSWVTDGPPVPVAPPVSGGRAVSASGVSVVSPGRREPPRRGVKERKSLTRSATVMIGIFKTLDAVSELSEVVDSFYDALPEYIRKRVERTWRREQAFLDKAGQYGIDRADMKIAAIWRHWEMIDTERAFKNLLNNAAQDWILGNIHKQMPKNQVAALEDGFKTVNKAIEDFIFL